MSHTSRLSYFLITFSYSPSPLSTASIIAFMASSSSSPSQISSISSPNFTHAPRTLNTLFAFAAVSSLYMNSTLHLYLLAMLQNIPAGLRCNPVGFVIVTFCLIIMYSPHFCLLFALAVLIVFVCLCLTAVLAFTLCFTALL
mgnify:CR=1 FL=1